MDIMTEILKIAKEGTLKTQIMYKANLSFTQLNDYLKFMLKNNLINQTHIEGKEVYVVTEKGFSFSSKTQRINQTAKKRAVTEIKARFLQTTSKPKYLL